MGSIVEQVICGKHPSGADFLTFIHEYENKMCSLPGAVYTQVENARIAC